MRRSLYTLLGSIIVVVVVLVLGLHSAYTYRVQRQQLLQEMQEAAAASVATLQKNIPSYMDAYAVAEYANLVNTEVALRRHFAIVVSDRNMGRILGQESYLSGWIRDPRGAVIEFDPEDPDHRGRLDQAFYRRDAALTAATGAELGTVSVYVSDARMNRELNRLVLDDLLDTFVIALLLVALLFLAIRHVVIRPLGEIATALADSDADGIPNAPLRHYGYRELATLTGAMNTMITVIRRSRASLRAEHDRLERALHLNRLILEHIPDLLWMKDADGRYLMCNPRFEAFFGAHEADILGRTDHDFVDQEQADLFREHDRRAIAVGRPTVNEEWVTFAHDGERALLETTKVPVLGRDGQVAGVMGIGHDITDRHLAVKALQERNARDAALNQSLPVGVLVYDHDLETIVFANDSAARILEMARDQILAGNLREVPWRTRHREGGRAVVEGRRGWLWLRPGEERQHGVMSLDFGDRVKWLSINTEPFYVDRVLAGAIVSFMDITREREIIQELDRERKRFQLAVAGTQDGMWDWDPTTDRVYFSSQWKHMLGYGDDEIGEELAEWRDRVHPDDLAATLATLQSHLRGETEVYESRHRLRCKDGTWKWVLDRGKALFDEAGKPVHMVGFHTDITSEMRHQEELEHTAKHDMLTGLPNRFLFNELIQQSMHRCRRNGRVMALFYIDLDGFKAINDTHGHAAGDRVLVAVAARMQAAVRQEDVVARLGGDEFVVGASDLERADDVRPLMQRLLRDLATPMADPEGPPAGLQVSASIGVSFYPQGGEIGPEALLRQADQAMYTAKRAGKNQYRVFTPEADDAHPSSRQA